MRHETKVVPGGQVGRFDWFCSCGEFGINSISPEIARMFAESHEHVANAHCPTTCRHCIANRR